MLINQNLATFTSIISLLSVQYPSAANELSALRSAIVQWHQGTQTLILQKNRAILSARSRGTQKLAVLFNEIENFFDNLLRSYSDPNLPIFVRTFLKIKQQFEFLDIDLGKFKERTKTTETQTQIQNGYLYGLDVHNLMKSFELRQNELDLAQRNLEDLQFENKKLEQQIHRLMDKIESDESLYARKIDELKNLLQRSKAEGLTSVGQTQRKNGGFRSNPQIKNWQSLSNKKLIFDLLNQAFDDCPQEKKQENETSLEELTNQTDLQLLRFIHCQALGIQGLLQQLSVK